MMMEHEIIIDGDNYKCKECGCEFLEFSSGIIHQLRCEINKLKEHIKYIEGAYGNDNSR